MAFFLMTRDYCHLKQINTRKKALEQQMLTQQEEITRQRKQIQLFANEINALKSKLVTLNDFEKSIRVIANITQPDENKGIFGVGGSIPEDLNPTVSLTKRHDSLIREMHEQMTGLDRASDCQQKEFETILKRMKEKQNILASTPSILPVQGRISSRFGYRLSPFTGRREMHKGLDIAAPKGDPIFASADGVVSFVGQKVFLGKTLVVDHGHGISTRYAHCDKVMKKSGDTVRRNEIIARVGNTGRSTGPHLHYEVRLSGVQVNPEKYIMDIAVDNAMEFTKLEGNHKAAN